MYRLKILLVTILLGSSITMPIFSQFNNLEVTHNDFGSELGIHYNFGIGASSEFFNDGNIYLTKSFDNEGILNFNTNTNSKFLFVGNNTQIISGKGVSKFHDIFLNNSNTSDALLLLSEIKVFGEFNFQNGIIIKGTNGSISFKDNATNINASNSSFFTGRVFKEGNDNFVFPIGGEFNNVFYYRPVSITSPNNEQHVFSAEYVSANTNQLFPHTNKSIDIEFINELEYWFIERNFGNSQVDITLNWNDNTTSDHIIKNLDELIVVRWNGFEWIKQDGDVNINSSSITFKPSEFGVFTLATYDNDIDDDTLMNNEEDINGDGDITNDDTDGDGIFNYLDNDDDGDGILTIDEDRNNNSNLFDDDCDSDGIPDFLDSSKCDLNFPTSFSPNNDGINDKFVIPNLAADYPNFILKIYNRNGNIVYSYSNNGNPRPKWWDGKSNGRLNIRNDEIVPAGTYWYIINYNNGVKKPEQAWFYLTK